MKIVNIQLNQPTSNKESSPYFKVKLAKSFIARLRGLLASKRLGSMEGLLLFNCSSIHTFGMHYPLDIVFLDRSGKVLKCKECVKPFRTASSRNAYYTLELNNGTIKSQGIAVNDHFNWQGMSF